MYRPGVESGVGYRRAVPPQGFDQGGRQHNAFVRLPRQLFEVLDCLPVLRLGRERPEAEHGLQFGQMFPPRLCTRCIVSPFLGIELELPSGQAQQGWSWCGVGGQHDAGIAHVAKLNREAEQIGSASALPDNRQIGFREAVMPDQVFLGVRQCQQILPVGG